MVVKVKLHVRVGVLFGGNNHGLCLGSIVSNFESSIPQTSACIYNSVLLSRILRMKVNKKGPDFVPGDRNLLMSSNQIIIFLSCRPRVLGYFGPALGHHIGYLQIKLQQSTTEELLVSLTDIESK